MRTRSAQEHDAGRAVVHLAARQVRRSAVVVAVLSAGLVALVAVQHATVVADLGALAALEALSSNPAVRTLFGPPRALADAGGFTVWRTGTVGAVLVATWSLLAATRSTRGEEDAGRWALLLGGTLGLRGVVLRHLAVLLTADLAIGASVALGLVLGGAAVPGAVLHGTGTGLVGAVFTAVGLLAAQVLPDRRSATGAAAGVLLVALLLRTLADGVPALSWVRWVTPFGLLAEVRPYAGDRPAPLAALALGALLVAAAALVLSGRRDMSGSVLRPRGTRSPRTVLLRSLPAFLVRRTLRPWSAWAAALGAYFLLIGLLATSVPQFARDNPRLADLAAQAGFALGSVEGYVASLFALLAVPVGLFAAARLAADVEAEQAGRLTSVLSAPVSRTQWLLWHGAVLLAACAALCSLAGLAAWAGARLVDAPLALRDSLGGAVNVLPVAALALGAALAAVGAAPRFAFAAGALPGAGGFVWLVLADALAWPAGVRDLSPLAHVAPVPAAAPALGAAAVLLVLALGGAAAGAAAFERRDLLR